MKLWVDDVRPSPPGYHWARSVNEAISKIKLAEYMQDDIDIIDIDHDAGDYASDGGDYIKLLDWCEQVGINVPIHIHSMNPVGVENMRRIIERNKWLEV